MSRASVYKAIASGSIPHVRVSNSIRIPLDYLEGALTAGIQKDPAQRGASAKVGLPSSPQQVDDAGTTLDGRGAKDVSEAARAGATADPERREQ